MKKVTIPFPFVMEELMSIRPTIKSAFGFTYFYLDDKLLCCLRQSDKQPSTNGMWIFTTTEDLESLSKEFPDLSRRYLWRSGKNAWVVLPSRLAEFEEYAFRACELIVQGDRRIGRISRGRGGRRGVTVSQFEDETRLGYRTGRLR
jgi:hypothetical protein